MQNSTAAKKQKNNLPDAEKYERLIGEYESIPRDPRNPGISLDKMGGFEDLDETTDKRHEKLKQLRKVTGDIFRSFEQGIIKKIYPDYKLGKWEVGDSRIGMDKYRTINLSGLAKRKGGLFGKYKYIELHSMTTEEHDALMDKIREERTILWKKYGIRIEVPYYFLPKLSDRNVSEIYGQKKR